MKKVYIFGTVEVATAFALTAQHFGHEAKRIGSALVMLQESYQDVLDKTFAIPAALSAPITEED